MALRESDCPIETRTTGWLPAELAPTERANFLIDALFEGNPDMVLVVDAHGRIAGANGRALTEYGYARKDLDGQSVELLLPLSARDHHACHMQKYMLNPQARLMGSSMNLKTRDAQGSEFPVDVMLRPVNAGNTDFVFVVCHRLDAELVRAHTQIHAIVTEQKAFEESQAQLHADLEQRMAERTFQLESTVDELRAKNTEVEALAAMVSHDLSDKEVLLREIYHRVKNNLQVVQSLLRMGARTLHSADARKAIETAVQRVHIMAVVHEHLYQVPDLASLSVALYLRDIVEGAIASNTERPDQVQLRLEADEIAVPLDSAIPLGLLANELVSNCLKHGLAHGRQGTVSVSVRIVPGAVRFVVHDDGVGLPENFDAAVPASMGIKLAGSLAHQLGGRLVFTSDHGCRVEADLSRLCPPCEAVAKTIPYTPQASLPMAG